MTQFAHPIVDGYAGLIAPEGALERYQSLSIASVMIQTAFLMGLALLVVRRWRLPFGFLTIMLTLNALALGFMDDRFEFVAGAFMAGLAADALLRLLGTPIRSPSPLHLFGFALPTAYYLFYFLTLQQSVGLWWSVHLWTGTVVMAGLVGLMASYLVSPLKDPDAGAH